MYVDKTGIGDAVVDELEGIGIPEVKGVFFTDAEKENMLNYLKLLMEKKQLRIQGGDKQLIAQINEQQYEYLQPSTAQEHIHMKYRHPRGRHDDQLFALALACYATKEANQNSSLSWSQDKQSTNLYPCSETELFKASSISPLNSESRTLSNNPTSRPAIFTSTPPSPR